MNILSKITETVGSAVGKASIASGVAALCLLSSSMTLANPITDMQRADGDRSKGLFALAVGGGTFLVGESLEVDFHFLANQRRNGTARGRFHFAVELGGLPIDFRGEVICVSVDPANNRAWIGAVVTRNESEHPSFIGPIHQPGRDVWFRVLDNGVAGTGEMDRSTFLGFEGAGGIITSEEYCQAQIWPDENARTSPVIRGNILVLP